MTLTTGLRDPTTREQLTLESLTSNRALRRQIDRYLMQSVDEYVSKRIEGEPNITDAWAAIKTLVENLGDDTSEPALMCHKRVFSLIRDSSGQLARGFVEVADDVKEQILGSLMHIPSSLAKEAMFALLKQFNSRYSSQRSKRPRRTVSKSPTQTVTNSPKFQSPPAFVQSAGREVATNIGLNGLFASHDKGEVELAIDFAVLFMQPPYQFHALNHLGRGDEGARNAILALQKILGSSKVADVCSGAQCVDVGDEDRLVLKQALQEIVLNLNVWCSHAMSSKAAAALHESFPAVEALLHIISGPPWPELEVAEPIITAVLRHGGEETTAQLCQLLRGSCKSLLHWIVTEVPKMQESEHSAQHMSDLLLSFCRCGIGLEETMGWDAGPSQQLAEGEAALVRQLLNALAKELRMSNNSVKRTIRDDTNDYIKLMCILVRRSKLGDATKCSENGLLAAECIHTINEQLMLQFCSSPVDLVDACLELADCSSRWSPNRDAPRVASCSKVCLLLARDIVLQQPTAAVSKEKVVRLMQMLLSSENTDSNEADPSSHLIESSIAALCITHRIAVCDITNNASQLRALCQLTVDLPHMILLAMQPYAGKYSLTLGSDACTPEHLRTIYIILRSGLRQPMFNTLQHCFENVAESLLQPLDPHSSSAAQLLLDEIVQWILHSTSCKQTASALLLMQQFAAQHALRGCLVDMTKLIPLLNGILYGDLGDDGVAVTMALCVYDSFLADKTDQRISLVPFKVHKSGLISLIFRAMAATPDNQALHQVGIVVAFKLTSRCKDVDYAPAHIELLIADAAKWSDSPVILAHIFGIQMYLSTRKGYKNRMCKLDCVMLALEAVSKPDVDITLIRNGCGVLRNAARNVMEQSSDQKGFPWKKLAKVATRLMTQYPHDREIQYRGCGVLVNITSSSPGRIAAAEELSCDVIHKAAERHRDHSELQLWALHFYVNFDFSDEFVVRATGKTGALPPSVGKDVSKIMANHKANQELQSLCLSVTSRLLDQYKNCDKELQEFGWAKDLYVSTFQCLSRHMGVDDIFISAVKIIHEFLKRFKCWATEDDNACPILQRALAHEILDTANLAEGAEAKSMIASCLEIVSSSKATRGVAASSQRRSGWKECGLLVLQDDD